MNLGRPTQLLYACYPCAGCSGSAGFGNTPVSHMYMQCCTVVLMPAVLGCCVSVLSTQLRCWHISCATVFLIFIAPFLLLLDTLSSGFGPSRPLPSVEAVGPYCCKAMPRFEKDLVVVKMQGRPFPSVEEKDSSDWSDWPKLSRVHSILDHTTPARDPSDRCHILATVTKTSPTLPAPQSSGRALLSRWADMWCAKLAPSGRVSELCEVGLPGYWVFAESFAVQISFYVAAAHVWA